MDFTNHNQTTAPKAKKFLENSLESSLTSSRVIQYHRLQHEALVHLCQIVSQLMVRFGIGHSGYKWGLTIVQLIREAISLTMPDVRHGDNMDIRNYVKVRCSYNLSKCLNKRNCINYNKKIS